jgi:hypothetical protein
MSLPGLGSRRHSSIEVSCIRSKEITRIVILKDNWNIVQDFWLGSGKEALNKVSNSSSFLQCHFASLPKDREGMSVIAFFFP